MSQEWINKQKERYRYVTEYNRDNAIDWLNGYYDYGHDDRGASAADVIQALLDEANRNNQERFTQNGHI